MNVISVYIILGIGVGMIKCSYIHLGIYLSILFPYLLYSSNAMRVILPSTVFKPKFKMVLLKQYNISSLCLTF